jgi:hypothetical protein
MKLLIKKKQFYQNQQEKHEQENFFNLDLSFKLLYF